VSFTGAGWCGRTHSGSTNRQDCRFGRRRSRRPKGERHGWRESIPPSHHVAFRSWAPRSTLTASVEQGVRSLFR